jgi:hypothetical protein
VGQRAIRQVPFPDVVWVVPPRAILILVVSRKSASVSSRSRVGSLFPGGGSSPGGRASLATRSVSGTRVVSAATSTTTSSTPAPGRRLAGELHLGTSDLTLKLRDEATGNCASDFGVFLYRREVLCRCGQPLQHRHVVGERSGGGGGGGGARGEVWSTRHRNEHFFFSVPRVVLHRSTWDGHTAPPSFCGPRCLRLVTGPGGDCHTLEAWGSEARSSTKTSLTQDHSESCRLENLFFLIHIGRGNGARRFKCRTHLWKKLNQRLDQPTSRVRASPTDQQDA